MSLIEDLLEIPPDLSTASKYMWLFDSPRIFLAVLWNFAGGLRFSLAAGGHLKEPQIR